MQALEAVEIQKTAARSIQDIVASLDVSTRFDSRCLAVSLTLCPTPVVAEPQTFAEQPVHQPVLLRGGFDLGFG